MENKTVDVVVFAGQSNMAGRGNASEATECDLNAGFEYKSVSNPTALVPITEPFGLGEDRIGGIDDSIAGGGTRRSGSMVSSVANEYYRRTARQIVAVSASIGGTSTEQWKSNFIYDAVDRLDKTKAFLKNNDIKIDHIFVVWCQGETDGDNGVSAQEYTENTIDLFKQLKEHGAEKCFLVQTGHFNYIEYPDNGHEAHYEVIRTAQSKLCKNDVDFILAGSFKRHIQNMIDPFHYNQKAYNNVGKDVGIIMAEYISEQNKVSLL